MRHRAARGVTLLECLVVLGLLTIAALAAAPSLGRLQSGMAVEMTARALVSAMRSARGEAIGRQQRVALGPADGKNWSTGWVTFVDANYNGQYDKGDRLLGRYAPLPRGVTIGSKWGLGNLPVIAYSESGFARTSGNVWLSGSIEIRRGVRCVRITLNAYGRARVEMYC